MATKVKEKDQQKKKKKSSVINNNDDEIGPPPSAPKCTDFFKQENAPYLYTDRNRENDVIFFQTDAIEESMTVEEDVYKMGRATIKIIGTDLFNECIDKEDEEFKNLNVYMAKKGNAVPSIPILLLRYPYRSQIAEYLKLEQHPALPAMPIQDAERLFCGDQIALIKIIDENESKAVENSILIGPDHPLVDLLSTYKQSLIAVERERKQLVERYHEEREFRSSLWPEDVCKVDLRETCTCGYQVQIKAVYDKGKFLVEKLPVAKMKLESLGKDVQESYCHLLHSVLLAHYQIEEYISQVLKSNAPKDVRTALSLILEALRNSYFAPEVHADALQRWATALVAGLFSFGHLADLLFVCHHLYRQNRSVYWAGREIAMSAGDLLETARVIGILEVILTAKSRHVESATECTEDNDQVWEEVDRQGSGCVVGDNDSLRERDLLMILQAIPMREVIARLALVRNQDIGEVSDGSWADESGGGGVVKAVCGARVLLRVLHAGLASHPHYSRLSDTLGTWAVECMWALSQLHAQSKSNYDKDMSVRIHAELEAALLQAWSIVFTSNGPTERLPYDVLDEKTARAHYLELSVHLHDDDITLVPKKYLIKEKKLRCYQKIMLLVQMAATRPHDYEFAKSVLSLLLKRSFIKEEVLCECKIFSRSLMAKILVVHPFLYPSTISTFVTLARDEIMECKGLRYLVLKNWVPSPQEILDVLADLTNKLQSIIPHVLLSFDYSAKTGMPLETQMAIVSYLSRWEEEKAISGHWRWSIIRKLHVHRHEWGSVKEAPQVEKKPEDLYSKMVAVLTTSWGHDVPMICEYGVGVIKELCRANRIKEAVYCLKHVMLIMADAPESIAFTPMFGEVCNTIANSSPSLVQRALGRGGVSGQKLLIRSILQHLDNDRTPVEFRMALVAAWLQLCKSQPQLVEVILVCGYRIHKFDEFIVTVFMQDEDLLKHFQSIATSNTPTLTYYVLKAIHVLRELPTGIWDRLQLELQSQRFRGAKIHVNNALQLIGANIRADDLVIYKIGNAIISTPVQHPTHLLLWSFFLSLYLQRPQHGTKKSDPIGPLLFDGIIKSINFQQLRRSLYEAIQYHDEEKGKHVKIPMELPKSRPVDGFQKKDEEIFPSLPLDDIIREKPDVDERSVIWMKELEQPKYHDNFLRDFHRLASTMFANYNGFLVDAEKTIAQPYHASLSGFISSKVLEAGWDRHISKLLIITEKPHHIRDDPTPKLTPLQTLKLRLNKIKTNDEPKSAITLEPPLKEVPSDSNSQIKQIEEMLHVIANSAHTQSEMCKKLSQLNANLWRSVASLKVTSPIEPIKKSCPKNCKVLTFHIKGEQTCLSKKVEIEIEQNRIDANRLLVRLSRPHPNLATTIAALQTITRAIKDVDTAVIVCEKAWNKTSDALSRYPPAKEAFVALVTDLAQKYISRDGDRCSELIRAWSASGCEASVRQSLCGALVSPARLDAPHVATLYRDLTLAPLPAHLVFSLLSKFEIPKWVEVANTYLKDELLESILYKIETYGIEPEEKHLVVLELLCVHMCAVVDARVLRLVLLSCARAACDGALCPSVWKHVTVCVNNAGVNVPPEDMTMILYDLAKIWHEANTSANSVLVRTPNIYTKYVYHYASTLRALIHALRQTLVLNPHNTPEHVSKITSSCTIESWLPWLVSTTKLLPSTDLQREEMANIFVQTLTDTYSMVSPGAHALLQEMFRWVGSMPATELEYLLPYVSRLPWNEIQWFHCSCLATALKLNTIPEARMFLYDVMGNVSTEAWLAGVSEKDIAPYLAGLFSLMSTAPLTDETLKNSTKLPWNRLPVMALEPELHRFFTHHYSNNVMYHKQPQFMVVLSASEMYPLTSASKTTLHKRQTLLSHWLRAMTSPRSIQAYQSEATAMLDILTNLYSSTDENDEKSQNEVAAMLNLAMTVFCTEPAAAAVLSVWLKWIQSAPQVLVRACVRTVVGLTSYKYYAELADPVIKAYFNFPTNGWAYVQQCWSGSMFGPHSALTAYAMGRGDDQWIRTMASRDLNFAENESALALWVCVIVRTSVGVGVGVGVGVSDVTEVGLTLLADWAEDHRLSILRTMVMVTMNQHHDKPTPKLRLLSRLALCILRPSEVAVKMYTSAHSAVLHPSAPTAGWGTAPASPRGVPRLALILYPNTNQLFQQELDKYPDS